MTNPPAAESPLEHRTLRLAPWLLAAAALAAYANSFSGPFVFDDFPTIVENPTIRQLWPLSDVLSPPSNTGLTVNGRPLVNLSLAINYAIGGIDPRGYHVFNFCVHVLAGLALFGLVRRTLLQPAFHLRFAHQATSLPTGIALIWLLHPLQTAAVTYIVQRAEVMVGLCYLLTLYSFSRSLRSNRAMPWKTAAFIACAAGMATKEVMVSAPLMVLLYDRTFVAGSFATALRQRWRFYASLASTWLILGWLMFQSGGRGGTAGFSIPVSPFDYAITQIGAIAHYLRLTIWPHPLIFDYGGTVLIKSIADVWPQALVLGALLGATLWALKRNHVLGFLGAWFFAILAPSSSIVPVADTMFEHRMYLPLAAIAVALCAVAFSRFQNKTLPFLAVLALSLGFLTAHRNQVYASELSLWADTVTKRPENIRAHYTLGSVLASENRIPEALKAYRRALELKPDSFETLNNLGNLLTRANLLEEARDCYERALQIRPDSADARNNLGNALLRSGRELQAMEQYQAALRLDPSLADAHNNLANLHMSRGQRSQAIEHYEAALRSRAGFFDAHLNLANALAQSGRTADAVRQYEEAQRLRPQSVELHFNYALTLERAGSHSEAIHHYREALRLAPTHPGASARLRVLQLLAP